MINIKRASIFLSCLFICAYTFAYDWDDVRSMKFGIKAGFGVSSITQIKNGSNTSPDLSFRTVSLKPTVAWEVGIVFQNVLYNDIFCQSECSYRRDGVSFGDNFMSINGQQVSLKSLSMSGMKATSNIGKTFSISQSHSLLVGAGFFFSMEIPSEDKFRISGATKEEVCAELAVSSLNIGPTALLAIQNDDMQIGLNFGYGLVPVLDDYKGAKSIELKMSVGYFF